MTERWEQRFENFEKAFGLLSEVAENDLDALSDIDRHGVDFYTAFKE